MADRNQARAYGVQILPVTVSAGAAYWRVASVRHLTAAENRGKHNVYVDAVDSNGARVRDPNVRIGWTWEGRRPNEIARPAPLDKSPAEPMGNIPLDWGQVMRVWIDATIPSEAVEGMHTNHPDEPAPGGEIWNSIGHHSFYIQFQLSQAGSGPVEPPPTEPGPGDAFAALQAEVAANTAWRMQVNAMLRNFVGEL